MNYERFLKLTEYHKNPFDGSIKCSLTIPVEKYDKSSASSATFLKKSPRRRCVSKHNPNVTKIV